MHTQELSLCISPPSIYLRKKLYLFLKFLLFPTYVFHLGEWFLEHSLDVKGETWVNKVQI